MKTEMPAAIVLCGGQSRRMGQDKALLLLDGQTLLERTVAALTEVAQPIVLAAADGQPLPVERLANAPRVQVVRDAVAGQGPLAGLLAAGRSLAGRRAVACVCACDLPLLQSNFVVRLNERLGDHQAAVVEHDGRRHPLTAVYRIEPLVRQAEVLFASGERRVRALLDRLDVCVLTAADFADVDPCLNSLRNVNTPEDYAALVLRR